MGELLLRVKFLGEDCQESCCFDSTANRRIPPMDLRMRRSQHLRYVTGSLFSEERDVARCHQNISERCQGSKTPPTASATATAGLVFLSHSLYLQRSTGREREEGGAWSSVWWTEQSYNQIPYNLILGIQIPSQVQ